MTSTNSNLRKAAVLLRSVDADTAATLLGQLSSAEAEAVREAIRSLGSIDPDEQANVVTEFRRESPRAIEAARNGVELALSSSIDEDMAQSVYQPAASTAKRFEFLEDAPANKLASYLAREHAQTVAVVLSHLAPERAAAVLAALPTKLQIEALERLSVLGDTDAESVTVLERELAAWVKQRSGEGRNAGRRRDAVKSILAAADAKTRDGIVANLKAQNASLAEQIAPPLRERSRPRRSLPVSENRAVASAGESATRRQRRNNKQVRQPPAPSPRRLPHFEFDRLTDLDGRTLARMLGAADPNVLALALAGSGDELVDRICEQMPRRIAKTFRRELRRLGPTRLSDVEAAQRAIAELAAQQLAERQATFAAVHC